jgi:putative transposase
MQTKNLVKLKPKERELLRQLISKGKEKVRKITRCRILLLTDDRKTDTQIIESLDIARNTIRQVRQRYVEEGLEAAINERKRSGAPKKFNGVQKAKITAMACSEPPEGRSRWTLRLLADKVVELRIVDSISYKTVERTLKKMNLNHT